jgi:hypothetical protein
MQCAVPEHLVSKITPQISSNSGWDRAQTLSRYHNVDCLFHLEWILLRGMVVGCGVEDEMISESESKTREGKDVWAWRG